MKAFFVSLLSVLLLDFGWLGFVVKDFNLRQLSSIGRVSDGEFQLLVLPAIIAYVLMALSIAFFSVPKAKAAASDLEAFLWGAALGLFIYGIFDMTNLAIIKNYPLEFAIADVAWGTFLYGIMTWFVGRKLKIA